MATLKTVLETANGLYKDRRSGEKYRRVELLRRLTEEEMAHPVRLRRIDHGTYLVHVENDGDLTFELLSRRRSPRSEPGPQA